MYAHFFSAEISSGSKLARKFVEMVDKRKTSSGDKKRKREDDSDEAALALSASSDPIRQALVKGSKRVKNAKLGPEGEGQLPMVEGDVPSKIKLLNGMERTVSLDEQLVMLNMALGYDNPWRQGGGIVSDDWADDPEFAAVSVALLQSIGERAKLARVNIAYINLPNVDENVRLSIGYLTNTTCRNCWRNLRWASSTGTSTSSRRVACPTSRPCSSPTATGP